MGGGVVVVEGKKVKRSFLGSTVEKKSRRRRGRRGKRGEEIDECGGTRGDIDTLALF